MKKLTKELIINIRIKIFIIFMISITIYENQTLK